MTGLPHPRERPWLTVAEVVQITGEGDKAVRAALAAGQLPALRIGRYIRIPTAPLYELVGITPDMQEGALASGAPSVADSTDLETRHANDNRPGPRAA